VSTQSPGGSAPDAATTVSAPAASPDESGTVRVGLEALLADLASVPYAEAKRRLLELFDETYTAELLRRTGGNTSEAARRAGLDRSNFRRLMKRHRD
jgi:DNA-binding NtrC family response regulator